MPWKIFPISSIRKHALKQTERVSLLGEHDLLAVSRVAERVEASIEQDEHIVLA